MRTFGLDFRERNFPKFEGKYNCYVSVWGQLSGEYLGNIEVPIKENVTLEDANYILNEAEAFIDNNNHPVSIW